MHSPSVVRPSHFDGHCRVESELVIPPSSAETIAQADALRDAGARVPTTEQVRREYAYAVAPDTVGTFTAAGDAFDRWLAVHDAALLAHAETNR